jgi:hypothetical protein
MTNSKFILMAEVKNNTWFWNNQKGLDCLLIETIVITFQLKRLQVCDLLKQICSASVQ